MSFYSDVILYVPGVDEDEISVSVPCIGGTVPLLPTRAKAGPLVFSNSVNYIDFVGTAKVLDEYPWPRETRERSILIYDDEDADKPKAMSIDEAISFLRSIAAEAGL